MMMQPLPPKKLYDGCDAAEAPLLWPYRTNPLVLPGAKNKKDPPPTISYLQHHPNPMVRAGPGQYELVPEEIYRKQKVADSVIQRAFADDLASGKKVLVKPYNTPVGLYSEPNIVNSLNSQVSSTPFRKTVVYDPSKSETFRVVQEQEHGVHGDHGQEHIVPITRTFTPVKSGPRSLSTPPIQNGHRSPQPHATVPHHASYLGPSSDEIHQSNSFKRLMNMVMTDY